MKTIRLSDDEKFDSLFNRFDKTHECNGQTDRQTDRQADVPMALASRH